MCAELTVDAALSAGLYRRMNGDDARHWLQTALRRTAGPFALTALMVAAFGWGLQALVPAARSIGEALAFL